MRSILFFLLPLAIGAQSELCLDCHETSLETSVHAEIECLSCHTTMDVDMHIDEGELVTFNQADACGGCHTDEWSEYASSVHGLTLDGDNYDHATCVDCHGTHNILDAADPESSAHPANLVTTCGQCHADAAFVDKHNIAIPDPIARYKLSVHYRVLEESGYKSASCNDCHGTHNIKNLQHPQSSINYWNVAETCGQCHVAEYKDFASSDHWLALEKGVRDAPSCISCHGEHAIIDPAGTDDLAKKRDKADRTCLKCHSDDELAEKYGLSVEVAATYQDSYHGMAVAKGYEKAATCFDCHEAHNILGSKRDSSSVNPNNLKDTCGKCHPGATKQFAQTYTHKSVMFRETAIEDIIKYLYLALIAGVIGFMVLHNGLIIYAHLRQRRRERGGEPRGWRRFSRAEVFQHILLLTSFITLVITGFALKFPDSWWVLALGGLGLTEASRGLIHRGAALAMVSLSIWHAIYLFATPWGRAHFTALLPNLNDFKHAYENIFANLRGKPRTIKYGFFDYAEKLEYWALVWGTIIMIVSGFILWFPTMLGELTPVWFIKVAEAFHYWEAWLATLAIFIWHLFFTIFHPDDYPLNPTMFFSGKMDRHAWLHKHSGFAKQLEKELDAYNAGEIEIQDLSKFAKLRIQDREQEQAGRS